jgi:hypothetical protein
MGGRAALVDGSGKGTTDIVTNNRIDFTRQSDRPWGLKPIKFIGNRLQEKLFFPVTIATNVHILLIKQMQQ